MVKSPSDPDGKPPSKRERRDTASLLGRARDGDASGVGCRQPRLLRLTWLLALLRR